MIKFQKKKKVLTFLSLAELHSNQTMYSCGSLAPKMQRMGCGDCKFKKPSEHWEAADGCVYLANELADINGFAENIAHLLPQIQEASRHRHYAMHFYFLETVAKVLPSLAKKLGKKLFKPHLEGFLDGLFYAADCENALASAASRECLRELSVFLGPNILRGRVEQYNPRHLILLEQYLSSPVEPNFRAIQFSSHPRPMDIPCDNIKPTLGGSPQ